MYWPEERPPTVDPDDEYWIKSPLLNPWDLILTESVSTTIFSGFAIIVLFLYPEPEFTISTDPKIFFLL